MSDHPETYNLEDWDKYPWSIIRVGDAHPDRLKSGWVLVNALVKRVLP